MKDASDRNVSTPNRAFLPGHTATGRLNGLIDDDAADWFWPKRCHGFGRPRCNQQSKSVHYPPTRRLRTFGKPATVLQMSSLFMK